MSLADVDVRAPVVDDESQDDLLDRLAGTGAVHERAVELGRDA